ncbi:MAG: Gfo/Idh/MocA family protein [Acutalibacteraceae bacterium]|jgi:predicted dehydrogenase
MIRLGTVGTSAICAHFLDGAALTKRFVHTAVCSRSEKTGADFAKKDGCENIFTNPLDMAKSGKIDAVYIATPNVFHKEQSRIFLENGVHVLCEKPIVTKLSDYLELKELADRKGLIYMEAIIPRHVKHYSAVKSAISEIGQIQMARIDFCQRSSRLENLLNGEQVNIFDMSLHAGALMDIGVYCVYGALDLLGEPLSVTAKSFPLYNGADGAGSVILDYGSFPAMLTYSKTCEGILGSEIIGTDGAVKIQKISQYAGVILLKDGKETSVVAFPSKAELMSGEAERFAEYIENFGSNAEDYKNASALCEKVHFFMDSIKNNAGLYYPDK